MTRARALLLVATSLALSAPVVAVPSMSDAASASASISVQQCQNRAATIVGGGGRDLRGTNGPDVIVTNGAYNVNARGGDDLVCVTNPAHGPLVRVNAGHGDDSVVVLTGARGEYDLSEGRDRFRGGPGSDSVFADQNPYSTRSSAYAPLPPADVEDEADVIRTGGGNDYVRVGARGTALRDVVSTGAGNDVVSSVTPAQAARSSIDGGPGLDQLQVGSYLDDGTSSWVVDNAAEVGERDDVPVLRWEGVEGFVLDFTRDPASFVGTARDEFFAARPGDTVSAGDGDDVVSLTAYVPGGVSDVDGGAGTDLLDFRYEFDLLVDLPDDLITSSTGLSQPVPGFEGVDVDSQTADILGGDGPNSIRVRACSTTVHAGGGDDDVTIIRFRTDTDHTCTAPDAYTSSVYGQGGNDVLVGDSTNDDLLDGGSGTDSADGRGRLRGGGGTDADVCVHIEREIDC